MVVRLLSPWNMLFIDVTAEVLNDDRSSSVSCVQPLNMLTMLVTFSVLR